MPVRLVGGALAQQQIDGAAVGLGEQVVERIVAGAAQQGRQHGGIAAGGLGVGQRPALRVQPGQAVQRRIDALQIAQQARTVQSGLRLRRVLVQQGEGGVGLEVHARGEVIGELDARLQAALPLAVLGLLELLAQLPEQQGEDHQHQRHQYAFDRTSPSAIGGMREG